MRVIVERDEPLGYEELEYIGTANQQSNSTSDTSAAYINTGVIPTNYTKIECKSQFTTIVSGTSDEALNGVSQNSSRFAWGLASFSTKTKFYFGLGAQNIESTITRDAEIHTFVLDASTKSWAIDATTGSFTTSGDVDPQNPIYLFARKTSAAGGNKPVNMILYYCKIWENGTLIRDMIPSLRKIDKTPGLYDKVNKVFYTAEGTNKLIYKSKESEQVLLTNPKYQQVEYLESTGTQYIDTGYYPTNTTKYVLKTQFMNPPTTANYMGIIGVSVAPNDRCGMGFYNGKIRQQFGSGAAVSGANYNDSDYTNFNNPTLYECSKNGYYINGTLNWLPTKDFTGTSSVTAWLFNTHAEAEYSGISQKIYYVKIYDNNILVRDFVPVVRISDGKPGMYDRVLGNFYQNIGTDEFIVGNYVGNLPSAYEEVEYLESTGTQYIDAGFKPTGNTTCTFTFKYTGSANTFAIVGARGATWSTSAFSLNTNTNKFCFNYGNNSNATMLTTSTPTDNNIHTTIIGANGQCKFDSEVKTLGSYTFTCPVNFILFGSNNNGTISAHPSQIYSCVIREGNTLVRDFVPAVRKLDNKPGLFDRVNRVFYTNQGTGEFIYDYDSTAIPREYKEIEYIESTGTQYIDTGIYLTSNSSVEIDYQITNTSQSRKGIYGLLDTTGTYKGRHGLLLSPTNQYLEAGYGSTNEFYQYGLPDTNRHVFKQDKEKAYMDGELSYTFAEDTFETDVSAPLGNFAFTNYAPAECRYFGSKWWENDILVRDFVPVVRISDGKPGMYDKVTRTFFGNVGEGEFVKGNYIYNKNEQVVRFAITHGPSKVGNVYTRVEYLQSTGTQYIDTGIYFDADQDMEIMATVLNPSTSSRKIIAGDYVDPDHCSFSLEFGASPNNTGQPRAYMLFNNASDTQNSIWGTSLSENNKHVIGQIWKPSTKYHAVYYNGSINSQIRTATKQLPAPTKTIKLFLDNRSSQTVIANPVRIYDLKIKKNGVLVRDFIPVIDSNNVPYMYDRVTKTTFEKQGTGNFTVGSVIEKDIMRIIQSDSISIYKAVQYLQSSGTQYIDTGITGDGTMKWILDAQYSSTAGYVGQTYSGSVVYKNRFAMGIATSKWYCGCGDTNNNNLGTADTQRHTFTLDVPNKEFYVDSTKYTAEWNEFVQPETIVGGMALFGRMFADTGEISPYSSMRIYSSQIYSGSELLQNMIPVVRKTDNKPGMYDTVSGKFYTNNGTGEFTYGE